MGTHGDTLERHGDMTFRTEEMPGCLPTFVTGPGRWPRHQCANATGQDGSGLPPLFVPG